MHRAGADRHAPTRSSPPLVLALPAAVRVGTFTEGCRAVALDFLNRVSAPPCTAGANAQAKRELAN
jgi:hypothetical protein